MFLKVVNVVALRLLLSPAHGDQALLGQFWNLLVLAVHQLFKTLKTRNPIVSPLSLLELHLLTKHSEDTQVILSYPEQHQVYA